MDLLLHLSIMLFVLFIVLLLWCQRKCWQLIWSLNGWRGVALQPIFWILLLLHLEPTSVLETMRNVRGHFKRPLAIIVFTRVLLFVDDPPTMESVLNAPECLDKTFMHDGFFARRGLLHARGKAWKQRRKQLNPAFSQSILLNFFDTFNAVGNRLQRKITSDLATTTHATNDGAIDCMSFQHLEDLLSRAVLEISCLTIMGTETNFTECDEFGIAKAYKKLMELTALRVIKPWLQNDRLFRLLDNANYECSRRQLRLVDSFVSEIVCSKHDNWLKQRQQQHLHSPTHAAAATAAASPSSATKKRVTFIAKPPHIDKRTGNMPNASAAPASTGTRHRHRSVWQDVDVDVDADDDGVRLAGGQQKRIFIEQIFHLAAMGELTLQDIMDEANSMVLVSFETISNSIVIALLCLAAEPQCQQQLRNEIERVWPTASAIATLQPMELQQCKYLEMVVHESLRLLTTVPLSLRQVSREFLLRQPATTKQQQQQQQHQQQHQHPNRQQQQQQQHHTTKYRYIRVPQNAMILLDVFNMQRDVNHWGQHAQHFKPECHFGTTTNGTRHPYAFVPFLKGLRWCIGSRYSMYLLKIILVKLIYHYEFHTDTELQDLRYVEGISLKFQQSERIQFRIRKIPRGIN